MTKDTGDLTQFNIAACREYTLPREDEASEPKGWIQGNTKIWPVLEVATSYLHGKHGVEIRIMSLSRDNTHSWVRISQGSNKLVLNLNNNETEIPEDQLEEFALKLSAKDFACRSKAEAKPQGRELAGSSPRIVPIERRNRIDFEPGECSLSEYEVSKKVIYLLRHSQQVHREEDGAVHFWRMEENLQNQFPQSIHWSDDRWKACLAAGGGVKRRSQYCTGDSVAIVYFRSLQGHPGRNLIDPSLQDIVIPSNFFQHIYHVGCAFNLHSIINSGLILGGQNSSKRQTVFFLPVDPMDKSHKDPEKIDLNVPRRAQYLHNAWKRHQDAVYWVDINLAIRKGLTFYQTRSNAIILQGILPAYCIPKVVRLKTGEVLYEKVYMSPRPPPKISLRHDHDWTRGKVQLCSTVDKQPEGKVVRQSRGEFQHETFSQPTQPIPKPIRDRSGQPEDMQDVFVVLGETSRFHEINEKGFHGELCSSDRSGQPDERNSSKAHTVKEQHAPEVHREIALLNTDNEFNREIIEEDIDFKIPGLPRSTVKQLHRASVRELIQREPPAPTCSSTRPTTESII